MSQEFPAGPIILASQSPRRSKLLTEAGIAFEVVPPRIEEPDIRRWRFSPEEYARTAAYQKAGHVAESHPDSVVLGADTVVALNGTLFGKPEDRDDARRILSALTNTTQDVITGIALLHRAGGRQLIDHDVTHVTMRAMTTEELEAYLDTGEWEGKAGAYGIQDTADRFVTHVEGSLSNVVGLPVEKVIAMLETFRTLSGS